MPALLVAAGVWCIFVGVFVGFRALQGWRHVRAWFEEPSLRGVLVAQDTPVRAPFSERPALFVRVRLLGVGPEGGGRRILWEKTLVANARMEGSEGVAIVHLQGAQVEAPSEYRYGVVRVLARASRVVPRALSKAGYEKPPPADRVFELEEELIAPGDEVVLRGVRVREGIAQPAEGGVLRVTNLSSVAIAQRVAWGPLLALWAAAFSIAAGLIVLGSTYWLHR